MSSPRLPPVDPKDGWGSRSRRYWTALNRTPAPPAEASLYAISAGGVDDDRGELVSLAAPDGSVFVSGLTFAPSTFGGISLAASESNDEESYVARVSPSGQWQWVTRIPTSSYVTCQGLATFPDGTAVVCGFFSGQATFGATTLDGEGVTSGFVARITGSGSWVWARRFLLSTSDVYFRSVAVAPDGSLRVAGAFYDSSSGAWDLGGGVTLALANTNTERTFVVSLSGSDGAPAWIVASSSSTDTVRTLSVTTLPDGSSVAAGEFRGAVNFGSTRLEDFGDGGYATAFVARVSAAGAWQWAVRAGSDSGNTVVTTIARLPDGTVVATGEARYGPTIFGDLSLSELSTRNIFVARLSASSGAWLSLARAGGAEGSVRDPRLALRGDGSVLVTGRYTGVVSFGPFETPDADDSRPFLARIIPATGAWSFLVVPSTPTYVSGQGRGVVALPDASAVVVGRFEGTFTWGSITLESTDLEMGNNDIFVVRIGPNGQLP